LTRVCSRVRGSSPPTSSRTARGSAPKEGPCAEIYGEREGRPRTINFLVGNFIRAFGAGWRERWNTITLGELKRLGFNTVANWSDWKVASAARSGARLPGLFRGRCRETWCVGVHYFILYDQSALGRFDCECYNIGFLDVCNRPYDPLCDAARASHERMYDVAAGRARPFEDAPEYLPKLFL